MPPLKFSESSFLTIHQEHIIEVAALQSKNTVLWYHLLERSGSFVSYFSSLRIFHFFHLTYFYRQSPHSLHLYPHPLHKALCLILVRQSVLKGEKSAVVAVTVYPPTNDVDLVYFGLADDAGWLS